MAGMEKAGHAAGIFGYTGNHRQDVRVYIVKHFNEPFNRGRLYALDPFPVSRSEQTSEPNSPIGSGTYTGPAVRHVTKLLAARQEATKVLFVLTDSDHQSSYDGEYATADVHMAFLEARQRTVHPFAISFGNAGPDALSQMYGRDFITIKRPEELIQHLPRIYMATVR